MTQTATIPESGQETAIAVAEPQPAMNPPAAALQPTLEKPTEELSVSDLVAHVAKIQQVMRAVMKEGTHWGTIPGCSKPCLFKAGAETLGVTFRLAPRFLGEREPIDLGIGHREYVIKCELYHIKTGLLVSTGLGSCSTMEGKYRFRAGVREPTGQPVPPEYWELRKTDPDQAQILIGGAGYSVGRNEDTGQYEIFVKGARVEHDNPADYYNTILKVAKKRAHIDAILTATGASDIFSQDLEDLLENGITVEDEPGSQTLKPPAAPVSRPKKSEGNGKPLMDARPGSYPPEPEAQKELASICMALAQAGKTVQPSADYKTFTVVDASDSIETETLACQVCTLLSSFVARNGQVIKGSPNPQALHGAGLHISLNKARAVLASLRKGV